MNTILSILLVGFLSLESPAPAIPVYVPDSGSAVVAEPATYKIDPVHSEVSFRVRHLVGRVFGTFTDWEGTVVVDPANLTGIDVDVTIRTASIETFNDQRDDHLRTPDFFAVEEFPTMTFKSTRAVQNGDKLAIHGDLTIRGTTKPVVLDARYLGQGPDPWGGERIGFVASTTINRHDFGVSFNQVVDGTGVIGDEVEIEIAIEAVRQ